MLNFWHLRFFDIHSLASLFPKIERLFIGWYLPVLHTQRMREIAPMCNNLKCLTSAA